jgi:hypothetical protein
MFRLTAGYSVVLGGSRREHSQPGTGNVLAHDYPGRAYDGGGQASLGRADADRQRGDAQGVS